MGFLYNPAFWASLAALLIVTSVCFALTYLNRVILILAAICAMIGIVQSLWQAGHRVRYERPAKGDGA